MKRNKLLALSLLACTLLAGCKEENTLQNGSNPVGNVQAGDVTLDTVLDLQKFYDSLKDTSGGSVAVEKLLEKIAELEYVDSTVEDKVALKSTFSTEDKFSVKDYHVDAFTKEIEEKFEDVVDGTSYLDDDGNFDPEEYKDYLEEAYVIRKIPQYSTKAKKQLDFYTKLYNEDVAFNTIRQINNRFDITHNLENVVYNELIYMGYSLTVFNINGKEIDFLAAKNGKEYFVQVAYSITENSTYEREFAPFNMTDNSRKKIIITNDEIDYSTSTVQHIKLKDFLFMEDLEK